jgi:hypothetical protein
MEEELVGNEDINMGVSDTYRLLAHELANS